MLLNLPESSSPSSLTPYLLMQWLHSLDVCKQTERRWASKLLRASGGLRPAGSDVIGALPQLPPLEEYEEAVRRRQHA